MSVEGFVADEERWDARSEGRFRVHLFARFWIAGAHSSTHLVVLEEGSSVADIIVRGIGTGIVVDIAVFLMLYIGILAMWLVLLTERPHIISIAPGLGIGTASLGVSLRDFFDWSRGCSSRIALISSGGVAWLGLRGWLGGVAGLGRWLRWVAGLGLRLGLWLWVAGLRLSGRFGLGLWLGFWLRLWGWYSSRATTSRYASILSAG